jgi:hypothetical protein
MGLDTIINKHLDYRYDNVGVYLPEYSPRVLYAALAACLTDLGVLLLQGWRYEFWLKSKDRIVYAIHGGPMAGRKVSSQGDSA